MSEEIMKNFCCGGERCNCCSFKSPKFILAILAILILGAIVSFSILRDRFVNQQYKNVTVNGQGRVSYNPDLAVITLGVQIDKVVKADEALSQLNDKVKNIIKEVKAVGISEEEIQTQNYSLYPQYDYKDNISVVSGYNANQQLVIKVSAYDQDKEKLNRVITAASKAGANQVSSLVFDSSKLNDLKQEARLKAIEDAKSKAQDLAVKAGVELKEITGWYENLISPLPNSYVDYGKGGVGGMGGASASSPETPAGEREVIMEIGVSYSIK